MQVLRDTYYNQLLKPLFSQHDELVNAALQYFKKINVEVDEEQVNEFILSHPSYPSLLSISDCLTQWNVTNAAVKTEKDQIDQYPLPMLVHFSGKFIVITGFTTEHILYLDEKGKQIETDRASFLKKWNGIALLADTDSNETSKATGNKKNQTRIAAPAIILTIAGIAMVIAAGIYASIHSLQQVLAYSLLLVANFAGIILSTLLLWYQVDKNNPALKKICGNGKSTTDCGAVLDSKYAKIWGKLGWSEVGFFYFTGSFLLLLILPQATSLVSWLSLLALPYTLFSIGYQKLVAKKWCPLCLGVQALLITSFIAVLAGGLFHRSIPVLAINEWFAAAMLFLIPAAGWFLSIPFIEGFQKSKNSRFELARLKHDPQIFTKVLSGQNRIAVPPPDLGITLGNKEARHTIVTVSNPYCAPCSKAHRELKEVLQNNDVKMQVIFNSTNNPDDKSAAPVKHFLAIDSKGDEFGTEKAMDDWYTTKEKNYERFATRYQMNGELKKQDDKINAMAEWCNTTGINYTPAIFVNGYLLPEMYSIKDLKYVLREL